MKHTDTKTTETRHSLHAVVRRFRELQWWKKLAVIALCIVLSPALLLAPIVLMVQASFWLEEMLTGEPPSYD